MASHDDEPRVERRRRPFEHAELNRRSTSGF